MLPRRSTSGYEDNSMGAFACVRWLGAERVKERGYRSDRDVERRWGWVAVGERWVIGTREVRVKVVVQEGTLCVRKGYCGVLRMMGFKMAFVSGSVISEMFGW